MRLRYFFFLLVFALTPCGSGHAAEVGDRAPSCSVQAVDGSGRFDLAGYSGKVVYIDFWASWCTPCAESFPFLEKLYGELKSRSFVIIGVNLDENWKDAEKFLRKRPVSFTLGLDPAGHCPRLYGVTGMPSSYLVDRKGIIRQVHRGFKSGDKKVIRDQVVSLLGK